jgi:hypothetical protein
VSVYPQVANTAINKYYYSTYDGYESGTSVTSGINVKELEVTVNASTGAKPQYVLDIGAVANVAGLCAARSEKVRLMTACVLIPSQFGWQCNRARLGDSALL